MNSTQPTIKSGLQQDEHQTALLRAGVGALGRLAERWALADDAKARLVSSGQDSAGTVVGRLERISHLLGIYRAATALFGQRDTTLLQWLHAANSAPPFSGLSPIEAILDGRNLDAVRGYLECQLVA